MLGAMDLRWRILNAVLHVRASVRRHWHRARFIDYRNKTGRVPPAALVGGDHLAAIQAAVNRMAGTDTDEYRQYLLALRQWQGKPYRWLLRRPNWIPGGDVAFSPGLYRIGGTITLGPGVTLTGATDGSTRIWTTE